MVETSGQTWAAEEVGSTRAISNRTTIPGFDALHREAREDVGPFVDPRRFSAIVVAGDMHVAGMQHEYKVCGVGVPVVAT